MEHNNRTATCTYANLLESSSAATAPGANIQPCALYSAHRHHRPNSYTSVSTNPTNRSQKQAHLFFCSTESEIFGQISELANSIATVRLLRCVPTFYLSAPGSGTKQTIGASNDKYSRIPFVKKQTFLL